MTHVSPQHPTAWISGEITGPLRFDAPGQTVARRLEAGDIAVIDVLDLDTATAQALVAGKPRAVLNLRTSVSGRVPAGGAQALLDAGIVLVDQVDQAVTSLLDGTVASLTRDAEESLTPASAPVVRIQAGALDLTGALMDAAAVAAALEPVSRALLPQASAFAAQTAEVLDRLGPQLVGDEDFPLALDLNGRDVVVVAPGADHEAQWASLRAYVRDRRPVVIAVGPTAAVVHESKTAVDLLVGSLEGVPDAVVTAAKQTLLHAPASLGGVERVQLSRAQSLGITHAVTDLEMAAEDLAILVAHHSGARSIVTVGIPGSLEGYLDSTRPDASVGFLVRLLAGDRLVAAPTAAAWHRASVPAALVALMISLAVVALGVALWLNPDARAWFDSLWNGAVGAG